MVVGRIEKMWLGLSLSMHINLCGCVVECEFVVSFGVWWSNSGVHIEEMVCEAAGYERHLLVCGDPAKAMPCAKLHSHSHTDCH
jgi:hypothetical protein